MWLTHPKRRSPSLREEWLSDPAKRKEEGLERLLRRFGVHVSDAQERKLGLYIDELEAWNQKINLTGVSSRQRIIAELLVDSLLSVPFLPEEGTLLDVGAGAGFPAIPIKICRPGLRCQLLEPNSKRISFLKQVIRVARLQDIGVLAGRIEDHETVFPPDGYDIITSRAFVALPRLLSLCAPYLSPYGRMVAFLGSDSESIVRQSEGILDAHRMRPVRRIPYTLPGKSTKREIIILEKES